MRLEELEQVNEKFTKNSQLLMKELTEVVDKWFKKDPRMTCVISMSLSINIIIQIISKFDNLYDIFPELPDVFWRQLYPFVKLKEKWGKISGKQFIEEYQKIYESQFEEFFVDEQVKNKFNEWYESKK